MIVAKIKGGLGNQLFLYATARAMAARHGMPLRFDVMTGPAEDTYNRSRCLLTHFRTQIDFADPRFSYAGSMGRIRRYVARRVCARLPFQWRWYLEEKELRFDPRLLGLTPRVPMIYLDGYWQSERYFQSIDVELRHELQLLRPPRRENVELARQLREEVSVCVHLRRLHSRAAGGAVVGTGSVLAAPLGMDYYQRAIEEVSRHHPDAKLYCFSDDPEWARRNALFGRPTSFVTANHTSDESLSHEELWLMSNCRHFVLANSTFSWWAAWLSSSPNKRVYVPAVAVHHFNADWVPSGWNVIPHAWQDGVVAS